MSLALRLDAALNAGDHDSLALLWPNAALAQTPNPPPITSALRMCCIACIDTPRVPESSDAGTFHCLYG